MEPADFADPLTFHVAPPAGVIGFHLFSEHIIDGLATNSELHLTFMFTIN